MSAPRLLDLFCGAGGAAMGYYRAGFEVVGVDIEPQPRYPFEFRQADALAYPLDGFDAVHASPPCQAYSRMSNARPGTAERYPRLVGPVRERLAASGLPYVIENVEGAPLLDPLTLCGTMFDLRVYRHRLFEARPPIYWPPAVCSHFVAMPRAGRFHPDGWTSVAGKTRFAPAAAAMGIDWMRTAEELSEAIPPAYTEWVGQRLIARLHRVGRAAAHRPPPIGGAMTPPHAARLGADGPGAAMAPGPHADSHGGPAHGPDAGPPPPLSPSAMPARTPSAALPSPRPPAPVPAPPPGAGAFAVCPVGHRSLYDGPLTVINCPVLINRRTQCSRPARREAA